MGNLGIFKDHKVSNVLLRGLQVVFFRIASFNKFSKFLGIPRAWSHAAELKKRKKHGKPNDPQEKKTVALKQNLENLVILEDLKVS